MGDQGFELERPAESIPQGIEYANKAIELDDSLVNPYTYAGIMKLNYEWDWVGAETCFNRALSISHNDAYAHMQYSMYFESLGDNNRAIEEAQLARQVDPLSREVMMNLAWQYYQADLLPEAHTLLEHLLENEPDFWGAYWDIAHIYMAKGQYEQAIQTFKKADDSTGAYIMSLRGLGYAYAMNGEKSEAVKVIKELQHIQKDNYVSPYYFATIYMGLNQIDQTFKYLEQAYEDRSRSLVWLNVAKEYMPLKEDRRFHELIERIGIPSSIPQYCY